MKKISLILFVLFPLFSFGQENPKDPQAMALLDKATAAFDTKQGVMAEMNIVVENERDQKKETIPAKIWLKKEKFKLSIRDVDTYFDGKTQSVYMDDSKEVTISTPAAEDLKDINPLLLIKSYKNGYKMKYSGTVQFEGKTLDLIDLYPENLKNTYSRITISIEKESMRLYSVRTQGKDGVNTVVTIDKYEYMTLADPFFVFDPKSVQGIEIVDLR